MSDPLNLHAIARLVPHGARVLDLGCGDGAMLAHLQQHHGCTGYGVELDDSNVHACVQRGVNVIQLNLDEGLSLFADQSFDVVLQIDTLQHLRNAEVMLRETVRVGRMGVVAFPNFGHWRVRWALLAGGRMPMTGSLPTPWYETQNIHLCTVGDFVDLCDALNVEIEAAAALAEGKPARSIDPRRFIENWRAETAIFLLSRQTPKDGSSPRQDRPARTDLFD